MQPIKYMPFCSLAALHFSPPLFPWPTLFVYFIHMAKPPYNLLISSLCSCFFNHHSSTYLSFSLFYSSVLPSPLVVSASFHTHLRFPESQCLSPTLNCLYNFIPEAYCFLLLLLLLFLHFKALKKSRISYSFPEPSESLTLYLHVT